MKAKRFDLKVRNGGIGGGGFLCPCCVSPKRKVRKQLLRIFRRKTEQLIFKIERIEEQDQD